MSPKCHPFLDNLKYHTVLEFAVVPRAPLCSLETLGIVAYGEAVTNATDKSAITNKNQTKYSESNNMNFHKGELEKP